MRNIGRVRPRLRIGLVWLSTCILYQLNIVSDYSVTQYRTNASEIAHLVRIVCSGLIPEAKIPLSGTHHIFCLASADVTHDFLQRMMSLDLDWSRDRRPTRVRYLQVALVHASKRTRTHAAVTHPSTRSRTTTCVRCIAQCAWDTGMECIRILYGTSNCYFTC